jgi:outer membrane lipoprotein-sorting protein
MRVQRAGLLLAIVAAAAAATIAAPAAPADLFDDLYRRGQARNGSLRTFTAAFTEVTTSSLLERPLRASGTVSVERPARVALHYTAPDERRIVIDGDRMTFVWPARGLRQTRDIGASQRRVQKYFVDSSPGELRGHFEVAAKPLADGYLVTMVPKRKQIREGLAQLDLAIDGTSLLMQSMKMTFPNGDTKTMTFTDVRPDTALDPSVFRLPPAPPR